QFPTAAAGVDRDPAPPARRHALAPGISRQSQRQGGLSAPKKHFETGFNLPLRTQTLEFRKMKASNKRTRGSTFSAADDPGRRSKARGHPHHPSPPQESPDHPSPDSVVGAVVPKTTLRIALETPELLAGALSGETWRGWR